MNNKEFVFIYNPEQVKFFLNDWHLKVVDFGTGSKGDAFVMFRNDNDFKQAFTVWRLRKH